MTEKFESLLKERDITPTKQRLEIADLIFSKNQHFKDDLVCRTNQSNFFEIQRIIFVSK